MKLIVLALDLASVTGWAVGEPGGMPTHGSTRFARAGGRHTTRCLGRADLQCPLLGHRGSLMRLNRAEMSE